MYLCKWVIWPHSNNYCCRIFNNVKLTEHDNAGVRHFSEEYGNYTAAKRLQNDGVNRATGVFSGRI